jgi:hypothetical protein
MATKPTSRSLLGQVVIFGLFMVVVFYAFSLFIGFAPVLVPSRWFQSVGTWYFVLLSLVSGLGVGVIFGLPYGLLFPRSTLGWSLLCSGSVAGVYLALVQLLRQTDGGGVWWTPFTDALFMVALFTLLACLSARVRHAYAI